MNTEALLEVALGAERWIDGYAKDTDHGRCWGLAAERPDKYLTTVYLGSAGIALFYLELYRATGQARYLEIAGAAGHEIVAQLPNLSPTCAPMGGWVGYMFVLNELAKLDNDGERFGEAARACAQRQRGGGAGHRLGYRVGTGDALCRLDRAYGHSRDLRTCLRARRVQARIGCTRTTRAYTSRRWPGLGWPETGCWRSGNRRKVGPVGSSCPTYRFR